MPEYPREVSSLEWHAFTKTSALLNIVVFGCHYVETEMAADNTVIVQQTSATHDVMAHLMFDSNMSNKGFDNRINLDRIECPLRVDDRGKHHQFVLP